uniref:Uncharacterized protein n=1 Tax=Anguilla anguilla TaxID=7936 RepID=A0A0E9PEW0_ANGAN
MQCVEGLWGLLLPSVLPFQTGHFLSSSSRPLPSPLWGVTFVPKNWEACSCLTGPKYFPSALD